MKLLKSFIIYLVFTLFFISCNNSAHFESGQINAQDVIVTIDDQEIKWEEYLFYLKTKIAFTHNHFYLNYNLENSKKFWKTKIEGISPLDYIKTKTDHQLIVTKAILKLAQENNIYKDYNFENFKILWKDYNNSRIEKNKKGDVIYGAISSDMMSYHNYLINNIKLRLKEKLGKTQFKIDEKLLKEYYDKIKQKRFSFHESLEGVVFGFYHSVLPYNKALKRIDEVNNLLKKGFKLNKDLEKKYPLGEYKKIVFYDSVPIFGEDNPKKTVKNNLLKLNIGEFQVLKAQEGTFIIRLDYLSNKKYYPYEKVKKQVLSYYQNLNFDQLIQKTITNTRIVKNKKVYNSISKENFF